MPLNADDEVILCRALDGFYGSVLRTYSADQHAVSRKRDCLMVTGVDGDFGRAMILVNGGRNDMRESCTGFDHHRVHDERRRWRAVRTGMSNAGLQVLL